MTMQPVVSFLIHCHNHARHLTQCVQSILGQNFIDFEILILDDASTDETTQMITALSQSDPRIRLFRHEASIGQIASYDLAIPEAQGELIWMLTGSDALASPQALQEFVTHFVLHARIGLLFCRAQLIDGNGVPYERYIPHKKNSDLPYQTTLYPPRALFSDLLKENFITVTGVLLRKSCFERTGPLDASLGESAFWRQWLLTSLDWGVCFDPAPKVYQRLPMSQAGEAPVKIGNPHDRLQVYQQVETFLSGREYPKALRRRAQLCQLQFKRKLGLPLSFPERVIRLYRILTLR